MNSKFDICNINTFSAYCASSSGQDGCNGLSDIGLILSEHAAPQYRTKVCFIIVMMMSCFENVWEGN